ncbi:MAG: DUF2155 domain-containing protein [Caulobacterales bacterium]|jgi:hypothetical protein
MPSRLTPKPILKRSAWLLGLVGVAAGGLVCAQPAPPIPPPAPEAAPTAGPAEEAPPVNVPTPAPLAVPPISEKEVAPAPPPPAEAKPTGVPVRRTRYDVAVIEALDKVTAESLRFEAAVGRPIRYKSLVFTVKACERSAPDEAIDDSIAYLTVDSQPRPAPGKPALAPRQTFRGWMFASSPSLHPLEHPVYAAWLITCRAAAPPNAPSAPAR